MTRTQQSTTIQGFTLWEVLLVLSLVSSLAMLPHLALKRWQQHVQVTQFLATFEKQLAYTQQSAITLERNMEVLLAREQQKFSFAELGQSGKKFQEMVVPEDLQVRGPAKIVFLRKSGNNGYLDNYTFIYPKKTAENHLSISIGEWQVCQKNCSTLKVLSCWKVC